MTHVRLRQNTFSIGRTNERHIELNEKRDVVVEREIAHPPERVWRALTQPHLIEEWLMKSDFSPAVGHRLSLRGDWGGVLKCEVVAVELNTSLCYTWNFPNGDPAFDLKSVVTFTLAPTPAGTLLRVEQSGFGPYQNQAFSGAKAGWQDFLSKLESVLTRVG